MTTLCIVTPTYNRAHQLPTLYQSLLAQTDQRFHWLIVDDGSTDNTQHCVATWQAEAKLSIEYLYQANQGKHIALNHAIAHINAPLTFIVDSDDWLLPIAVASIYALHERYTSTEVAGYSFLRIDSHGRSLVNKPLPSPELVDTYCHVRLKQHSIGDMAEVWMTSLLQAHPFPVFPGEKFYSEAGVWVRISGQYPMVFTDIPIYGCEYCADGLTQNRTKIQCQSPLGVIDCSQQLMHPSCGLRTNIRACLRYCVFTNRVGWSFSKSLKESHRAGLVWLCYPPSYFLRSRWQSHIAKGD